MNIGIIGLGLIGGSMAKAICEKTSHTVFGYDINEETMFLAKMTKGIHEALDDSSIAKCELIMIAIRPDYAVQWVKDNAAKIGKNAIVVDLCGVKRCVVSEIRPIAKEYGFHYIGGHPMAGKEVAGYNNAAAHLYDGAAMILTPDEETDLPMLETLRDLFYELGFAKLTFSTPEEHDRIIAYTSQLAHIASNAYIKSPESQEQFGFSAGSFRDMTRVARLDEDMWTVLMMSNVDYLSKQVDILIDNLKEYQTALHEHDSQKLHDLLKEGREMKESAGGR
ncbi:MAG: prephenate dehydrogenase [Anaerolineaceae bacterium]|nr:prephenate dehydrogenase [Anaerolineaceae bacterium]